MATTKAHRNLVRSYAQDLRLFGTPAKRLGLAAVLVVLLVLPTVVQDDFWLSVLIYSGVTAIGAIGLNLLTGYCGQISLGHAFFIGAGAYCAALVGGDLGLPLPLWLLASAAIGAMLGGVIGPFTLRLRGRGNLPARTNHCFAASYRGFMNGSAPRQDRSTTK